MSRINTCYTVSNVDDSLVNTYHTRTHNTHPICRSQQCQKWEWNEGKKSKTKIIAYLLHVFMDISLGRRCVSVEIYYFNYSKSTLRVNRELIHFQRCTTHHGRPAGYPCSHHTAAALPASQRMLCHMHVAKRCLPLSLDNRH